MVQPVTLWRELFTRAASAKDGASKQLAPQHAQTAFANGRACAQNKGVKTNGDISFIVIRHLVTTTILLALLTGAACAQDVPVAPKKPVAAKQEEQKAEASSSPRLPPDPNKFAVIISGIGGVDAHSARFAK